MNTQEIKRAARDSKIGNAVFDALFNGMSLTDVAVKVRRMDKPEDMIPFLLRGLDLTHADIDNSPLKVDEDVIRAAVESTPASDDEVEENVYNALRLPSLKVCSTLLGKSLLNRGKDYLIDIEKKQSHQSTALVFIQEIADHLIGQAVFIWQHFHESGAEITTVEKDAFELVSSTRLQTNLTPDILEKVFERNIFLELPRPIHGFLELCFIRRGGFVFVYVGRRTKGESLKTGKLPAFMLVRAVNIKKQFGAITETSLAETFDDGIDFLEDEVAKWMDEVGAPEAVKREMHEDFKPLNESPRALSEVQRFIFDAIVFVTKLRLMILAEKPPVEETRTCIGKGGAGEGPKHRSEITVSVVSLTRDFRDARASYESKGGHIDKTGKKVVEKFIAGFIRRQHYGQNNALVKTIFVSPFTNRFWVNAGVHVTKVVK